MDPNIQSALIGAVATLFAALFGFWVVARQIAHEARIAMKQRAYEQIMEICEQASDAAGSFSNFIRQFLFEIEAYTASNKQKEDYQHMSSRVPKMLELQARHAEALITTIRTIERWLIIDPRIDLFKLAFNVCYHETYETYFPNFFPAAVPKMPTDVPHGESGMVLFPPEACTPQELNEIKFEGEMLIHQLEDFTSYLYDFQIEMQKLLMRGLFKHRVPNRQPIDPNAIVLSLGKYKLLTQRLRDETDGGRYMKHVEEEARRKFAASK